MMQETQAPWPARDGPRITGVRAIVTAPEGMPAGGRAGRHHRPRPVRAGLRHVHPALPGRGGGGRPARRPAAGRPAPGRHRGHHPDGPPSGVLAGRSGPQQRTVRCGPGAVGHRRQARRDAGLRTARRPRYAPPPTSTCTRRARRSTQTLDEAAAILADGLPATYGCRPVQPGAGHYGAPGTASAYPGAPNPDGWDVQHYLRETPKLFARAREVSARRRSCCTTCITG